MATVRTLAGLGFVALLLAPLNAAEAQTQSGTDAASVAQDDDPRRKARRRAIERTTLTEREELLIKRPDRERPEHPLSVSLFGRPLTFGGRYTALTRYEDSKLLDFDFFDLDGKDIDGDDDFDEIEDAARGQVPTDDQLRVNQNLQLDLFYPFTEDVAVYLEGIVSWRNLVWADHADTNSEWRAERGETWLYLGRLFGTPLGLQVGRQRFFDEREWWWDADLDSVRLRVDFERFHAELAVAQELLPVDLGKASVDREDRDILRILAVADWEWAEKQQLSVYALHHYDYSSRQPLVVNPPKPGRCVPEDEIPPNLPPVARPAFRAGCPDPLPTVGFQDESDADLTWLGFSAAGRLKLGRPGRLHYWLDFATVFGKETFTDYSGPGDARVVGSVDRHHVSGVGVDVGLTWELPLPLRPNLTLGYAFGSGKRGTTEQSDRGFRQTGLQDDSDKFRGVASFRFYGELLDPELANLHVATAGIGFRFLRKSSIDFVYHLYRQVHAAPFLREVDFKRDPDGVSRAIGQEWDVVVGIEEWRMLEVKLVGAAFRTGKAFRPEAGKFSYLASLRLRLNF